MSRRSKNIVDYFPHDVKHGRTMFIIESKFGNDGYAFWFKLLELLGGSENHYFDCREREDYEYLLALTRVDEKMAEEILKTLANLDAIHKELWDKNIIWSPNFIKGIEDVYRRRKDGECIHFNDLCKHLRVKCKHEYNIYGIIVNRKPQSKVEESKVEEIESKRKYYREELNLSNNNKDYSSFVWFLFETNDNSKPLYKVLLMDDQIGWENYQILCKKIDIINDHGKSAESIKHKVMGLEDSTKKYSKFFRTIDNWFVREAKQYNIDLPDNDKIRKALRK